MIFRQGSVEVQVVTPRQGGQGGQGVRNESRDREIDDGEDRQDGASSGGPVMVDMSESVWVWIWREGPLIGVETR